MYRKLLTVAALALSFGAVACTAEVEEEGSMPDVDVSGGQAPEIDVDPARVDVTTDTQTVVTPDVDITPTEGNDP